MVKRLRRSQDKMKEEDEDLFLVVVYDKDCNPESEFNSKQDIKQEVLDEDTKGVIIEKFLEQAGKHGEHVDWKTHVKKEPKDIEGNDSDYKPDYDGDPQYTPDDNVDSERKPRNKRKKKKTKTTGERHRYVLLKPSQSKSFVAKLRKDHPELRDDEELLVNTLLEVMKKEIPPEPPRNYFLLSNTNFECAFCGYLSESNPAAARHYQEKHGPRYLKCYSCGVDFRSKNNLYKHEKKCAGPGAIVVLKARGLYIGSKARSRPFLSRNRPHSMPPKTELRCAQCPAVFGSAAALGAHAGRQHGERPYRCHLCPAAYTALGALNRHLLKHEGIEFICDECGRALKSRSALITHMKIHQPTKRFGCGECSKRYSTKQALVIHMERDHLHLPPRCACYICPKRYPRMHLLREHFEKEHGMTLITRRMLAQTEIDPSNVEIGKVVFNSDIEHLNNMQFFSSEEVNKARKQPKKKKNHTENDTEKKIVRRERMKTTQVSQVVKQEFLEIEIPPQNNENDNVVLDIGEEVVVTTERRKSKKSHNMPDLA